jgi:hypothetical protein
MRITNGATFLAISVLLPAMLCTATAGKTIYVDDDATGANDRSSWGNACTYLQDAIVDANESAEPVEIRVAQGIYKTDSAVGITSRDREATFQLLNCAKNVVLCDVNIGQICPIVSVMPAS